MNIRVDLTAPIKDGTEVVFRSPVDCSQVTGLIVYYWDNGSTAAKEFAFADAHGNNVGDIDHLFAENVVVKVILDVTTGMAFVQNADTNAYIERTFIKTVNGVGPDENGNVIVVGGGADLIGSAVTEVNLYNKDDERNIRGYVASSGTVHEDVLYLITHPIEVQMGNTYKMPFDKGNLGNNNMCRVEDANGAFVKMCAGTISVDNRFIYFEFSEDCIVRFNVGLYSGSNAFMVAEESLYPEVYTPYGAKVIGELTTLAKTSLVAAINEVNEKAEIAQKTAADAIDFVEHINCFNKDDTRILNGYFNTSGHIISDEFYRVTHPIEVQMGNTYKMPFDSGNLGNNYKCRVEDVNGNLVRIVTGIASENRDFVEYTFEEDCIVRFNIGAKTRVDTYMVVKAEAYPNYYVPYGTTVITAYNIGNNNELATSNKTSLVAAINEVHEAVKSTTSSLLLGLKLSVNGDSICAGAGSTGGYAKIIGERNGMTVQNIGVGGGTITAEQYNGEKARHWISRTIANMDIDADYAIVEGGVNDASLGVPLGEISSGYHATLDDTTFYGAFESMLKQLTLRFAGKKIGYIAVHQMTTNFRASNEEATSYYWAAKKCCEKWGVPFLDLNTSVPAFAYFRESGNDGLYALTTTYTKNGDGWHPNEDGYKKYYVPKIEAWLQTL